MADTDFDQHESNAALTHPIQVNSLKKGDYCMLGSRPCKIVEMASFKNGKHGHAKTHLVGIDIFTFKKCEDMYPSAHTVDVPMVTRREYLAQFIDKEGYITLLDDDSNTRSDLKVENQEDNDRINSIIQSGRRAIITTIEACHEEHISIIKEAD